MMRTLQQFLTYFTTIVSIFLTSVKLGINGGGSEIPWSYIFFLKKKKKKTHTYLGQIRWILVEVKYWFKLSLSTIPRYLPNDAGFWEWIHLAGSLSAMYILALLVMPSVIFTSGHDELRWWVKTIDTISEKINDLVYYFLNLGL